MFKPLASWLIVGLTVVTLGCSGESAKNGAASSSAGASSAPPAADTAPPADGANGAASTDAASGSSAADPAATDGAAAETSSDATSESPTAEVAAQDGASSGDGQYPEEAVADGATAPGNSPYENDPAARAAYGNTSNGESQDPYVSATPVGFDPAREGSVVAEGGGEQTEYGDAGTDPNAQMAEGNSPYGSGPFGQGSMAGGPGIDAAAAAPPRKSLAQLAQEQFVAGNETKALDFVYAQALSGEGDGGALLQSFGWVPGLGRPTLVTRWGIGITFKNVGRELEEGQDLGALGPPDEEGNGAGRGSVGGGSPYGSVAPPARRERGEDDEDEEEEEEAEPATLETFTRYTGYYGEQVLERLKKFTSSGAFGVPLQTLAKQVEGGEEGGTSGLIGDSSFGSSGPYGPGFNGAYGSTDMGTEGSAEAAASPYQLLAPGIVMLGVDKLDKLVENARTESLDVLLVFDVQVQHNARAQRTLNSTRMRVFNVRKGTKEPLFVRKALINRDVTTERRKGREPVKESVESLAKYIEANLKIGPLPAKLQAEQVSKRLAVLAKQKASNPLPSMVEVAAYAERGLAEKSAVEATYGQLASAQVAKALVSDREGSAKRALASYLGMEPDELAAADAPAAGGGGLMGQASGLLRGFMRSMLPGGTGGPGGPGMMPGGPGPGGDPAADAAGVEEPVSDEPVAPSELPPNMTPGSAYGGVSYGTVPGGK